MEPAWGMAALWILFGGTHIGLASSPIRKPLVKRTGELGFNVVFSLVAAVSFTLLVSYYSAHRYEGAPGFDLGRFAVCHWVLVSVIVVGVMLAAAGLASYARSPYALFGKGAPAPRGIERITRHAFFSGVALFSLAHVLLATHLIGTIFAAGLACLAILGSYHQDAKLLARRGQPHADYLAVTSAIPFAAIAARRQRLVWNELPFAALGAGIAIAIVLRAVHGGIFSFGGAWVISAVLLGAATATARSWRAARRRPEARHLSRTERLPARLLYVIAVAHVVVGAVLFQEPLAAIWRDGIVNSIGSEVVQGTESWVGALRPQFDRAAAFWFVLFGPCLWLLGQIVNRAVEMADGRMLRILGWNLLAFGIVGVAVMPVSGFWLLIAFTPLLFSVASRLEPRSQGSVGEFTTFAPSPRSEIFPPRK